MIIRNALQFRLQINEFSGIELLSEVVCSQVLDQRGHALLDLKQPIPYQLLAHHFQLTGLNKALRFGFKLFDQDVNAALLAIEVLNHSQEPNLLPVHSRQVSIL